MQTFANRIASQGQRIFGASIVALGVEHLICAQMAVQPFPAQFHAIVIPVIPWVPAYPWLAYLTGVALIAAGASMATNMRARAGALFVGGIFLTCDLILHIPRMLQVPGNWGLRGEVCEMLALGAAALIVAGTLPRTSDSSAQWDGAMTATGRILFAIAAIVFGVNHFLKLDLIASLIPAWMPGHLFLAGLTGAAMIVAGVCIMAKWMTGRAALGLGAVYLIFVLTLHVPRVLAAPQSADEWSSALIALAMCGASWICAAALPQSAPRLKST